MQIQAILERLEKQSSAFASIAASEDPEYVAESPYQNHDLANSKYIDFAAFEARPLLSEVKAQAVHDMKCWRWALRDRHKYEKIIGKFHKWIGKLKELLPLSIAIAVKNASHGSMALDAIAQDENAKAVGLASHANLWQLMLDPAMDNTNFNLDERLLEADAKPTGASTLVMGKLQESGKSNWGWSSSNRVENKVLVEYKNFVLYPGIQGHRSYSAKSNGDAVRQLASLLSLSGNLDLRTLPLRGYTIEADSKRYAFVFGFPPNARRSVPVSLHTMIDTDSLTAQLSLPDRFNMAQTVAKTLSAFHSANWVHKSMRSRSIVMFESLDDDHRRMVKSPYLINFESSRPELAGTQFLSTQDLELSLYYHPDRNPPITPFAKIHDIYALGVVLLEIGLWRTALSIYNQTRALMKPEVQKRQVSSREIKSILLDAARRRLSHHMGAAYASAVEACLSDRFDDLTHEADFPMRFRSEVVDKLDMKAAQDG